MDCVPIKFYIKIVNINTFTSFFKVMVKYMHNLTMLFHTESVCTSLECRVYILCKK